MFTGVSATFLCPIKLAKKEKKGERDILSAELEFFLSFSHGSIWETGSVGLHGVHEQSVETDETAWGKNWLQ